MDNVFVTSISYNETKEWLLKKHYAKRMCSIKYSFGLFVNNYLRGVLTIGKPASPFLCIGVCGQNNSNYVYELNRLIVDENLKKNILSYFVSQCLKKLPKMIIVSYADTKMHHCGYIYQATNWLYTGKTKERTDITTQERKHSRHYNKNIDYTQNRKIRSSKHRYIYFTGNKKEKNFFKKCLKYEIQPYPKEKNKRYDATYKPKIQTRLF